MNLFVNACVRPQSRTLSLAGLAAKMIPGDFTMLDLYKDTPTPLQNDDLALRDAAGRTGDFSHEIFRFARQFAEAENIVVAAPYWDLSFPAALKCYLESICVNGLTFRYDESGNPEGLCKAKRLVFVTTAGGKIPENNYGFDYIASLCKGFFGIADVVYIKAEGLDIYGADVYGILHAAEEEIKKKFS